MSNLDPRLDRLLRAAAQGKDVDPAPQAPFGFDTRVVALWRSQSVAAPNGLARLLRRAALTAMCVTAISSAAALYQFNQDGDDEEVFASEYAIADNAIQTEIQ